MVLDNRDGANGRELVSGGKMSGSNSGWPAAVRYPPSGLCASPPLFSGLLFLVLSLAAFLCSASPLPARNHPPTQISSFSGGKPLNSNEPRPAMLLLLDQLFCPVAPEYLPYHLITVVIPIVL